jgi:hypothetical protein
VRQPGADTYITARRNEARDEMVAALLVNIASHMILPLGCRDSKRCLLLGTALSGLRTARVAIVVDSCRLRFLISTPSHGTAGRNWMLRW